MAAGLGADFAPEHILVKLPGLYTTDGPDPIEDKPLLAKWFSPYSGWTWYAAEHTSGVCFGYVEGFECEWGTFDLGEMEAVRGMGGSLPMVERDVHFEPTTLRQLRAAGCAR